jgi:hypothetical protein
MFRRTLAQRGDILHQRREVVGIKRRGLLR